MILSKYVFHVFKKKFNFFTGLKKLIVFAICIILLRYNRIVLKKNTHTLYVICFRNKLNDRYQCERIIIKLLI